MTPLYNRSGKTRICDRRRTYESTKTCRLRNPSMMRSVWCYLEIALTDQAEAWLQATRPADPTAAQPAINKATLVELAAHCFLDDEGIFGAIGSACATVTRFACRAIARTGDLCMSLAASVTRC
jgi:hypothetical protein